MVLTCLVGLSTSSLTSFVNSRLTKKGKAIKKGKGGFLRARFAYRSSSEKHKVTERLSAHLRSWSTPCKGI